MGHSLLATRSVFSCRARIAGRGPEGASSFCALSRLLPQGCDRSLASSLGRFRGRPPGLPRAYSAASPPGVAARGATRRLRFRLLHESAFFLLGNVQRLILYHKTINKAIDETVENQPVFGRYPLQYSRYPHLCTTSAHGRVDFDIMCYRLAGPYHFA